MKKHLFSLMLAWSLLLAVPAHATQNSMEHFVPIRTYSGQFQDLTPASPFYDNVTSLYELGLTVGKGNGTYGLKDSLTVGQAVIFAGRIRSLYCTGDPEAGASTYKAEGQATAVPYLRYLQAEGVLDTALDKVLFSTATRGQMAHVLANILPESALPASNDSLITQAYASGQFITDVSEYTSYNQDILKLYRCGVVTGNDATGSFLPDAPITRGAVAAMLTRLVVPTLRVTPEWQLPKSNSAEGTTLADLIIPGTYITAPATDSEMDESIRYMLANGNHTISFDYETLSYTQARKIMMQALWAVKSYCEQSYNSISCSYTQQGDLTLTFSAFDSPETELYRTTAMEAAIAVHDQLWSEGLLREGMTELEKAQVYFTWICENCVYDHTATDNSISHLAYSLFEYGIAVCDGYTGAYNLFLKLEGIDCYALYNDTHIWTVATLDGVEYHIDTTWGDSDSHINYTYFAMTPEQSMLYHK